ncbi:MAG: thioredoxin domain-containing protein [Deltaproteobacteria bacterium]|nr:thioredoxin domain-containing protein [Deltaproteobacteria bacterium]
MSRFSAKSCVVLPVIRLFLFCLLLGGLAAAPLAVAAAPAGATADTAALREAVRDLLREDPDLVLDILRENSEIVLDIAQQGSEQRRFRILLAQWHEDMSEPKKLALADRPSRGPANAPVVIAAFTDFTCVHCRQGEKILENILNAYPGRVRIVYKPLPTNHPGSIEAAEFMLAGYLQDKSKSWNLFTDFFENQESIVGKSGDTYLRSAATARGFNMQKLLSEAKGAKVKKIMQEDAQEAENLKIQGTPCFVVNDIVIRGALQENFFREAVNLALSAAENK